MVRLADIAAPVQVSYRRLRLDTGYHNEWSPIHLIYPGEDRTLCGVFIEKAGTQIKWRNHAKREKCTHCEKFKPKNGR